MEVLWLSTRKVEDLSASTQQGILTMLRSSGMNVKFVGPVCSQTKQFNDCEHIQLPQRQAWGRRTSSFAKHLRSWLEKDSVVADVILVDWTLVHFIQSSLSRLHIRKILIDRSPPADAGILARLQWRHWKTAWTAVASGKIQAGCVVSAAHRKLVISSVGVPQENIDILPAGISKVSQSNRFLSRPIQLVYHGRLDKNRGLQQMFDVVNSAIDNGLDMKLTLFGDGDLVTSKYLMSSEHIHYGGHIEHNKILEELERFHVGLLPMPATKVWSVASPLKQNEYLAAGLVILGIDHQGHRLEQDYDFLRLYSPDQFLFQSIQFLSNLSEADYEKLSQQSRTFAQDNCLWDVRCEALLKRLKSL